MASRYKAFIKQLLKDIWCTENCFYGNWAIFSWYQINMLLNLALNPANGKLYGNQLLPFLLVFLFQIPFSVITNKTNRSSHSLLTFKAIAFKNTIVRYIYIYIYICVYIFEVLLLISNLWPYFHEDSFILHFPSDNDILCNRLSLFIPPQNDFHLIYLDCVGNQSFTKIPDHPFAIYIITHQCGFGWGWGLGGGVISFGAISFG